MRKASAPARNNSSIFSGLLVAGPKVANMRTLRFRGLGYCFNWKSVLYIGAFEVSAQLLHSHARVMAKALSQIQTAYY